MFGSVRDHVSNHWCIKLRLNTMARRRGAVGKINFVVGKWAWKHFGDVVGDEVVDDGGETGCVSNGSANFSAVEPLPWRMIRVVLCISRGMKMSGGGLWDFDVDMIEKS
jgi:hypothetical protein